LTPGNLRTHLLIAEKAEVATDTNISNGKADLYVTSLSKDQINAQHSNE
jgi:hypothetical protein